jgi:hypothetical protein
MLPFFLSHDSTWDRDAATFKTVALYALGLARTSTFRLDDRAYS